jgi:hypothetical protein
MVDRTCRTCRALFTLHPGTYRRADCYECNPWIQSLTSCKSCGKDIRRGRDGNAQPTCLACRQANSRQCSECGAGMSTNASSAAPVCLICRRSKPKVGGLPSRGVRECRWCGSDFQWHPKVRTTYCSNRCRAMDNGRKSSPVPWRSCLKCGRWFSSRQSRGYCHAPCRPASTYTPTSGERTLTCRSCDSEFTMQVVTRPRDFCSPECGMAWTRAQPEYRLRNREAKARRRAHKAAGVVERFKHSDIFERDGWCCGLCGKAVNRGAVAPHPLSPTIDHIIPLSRGGDHTRANVQCAHFLCNARKGTQPMGEQLRLIG